MGITEYFLTSTYRDWGDFSVEHLVVLVGLLCLILLLYSIIRNKRTNSFKKARNSIFESKPLLNKQELTRVKKKNDFFHLIVKFFLESLFVDCK